MLFGSFPFAQSLIYLALFGLLALGLLMVLAGRAGHLRGLFRPGVALTLLVGTLFAADLYKNAMMEWNPMIRTGERVVGKWSDGRETVTLHADHRFDFHSSNEKFSGEWSRFDFNLRLKAKDLDRKMRFVMWGSEIYLMPRPPEDPDDWDGSLGLQWVP